MIKAILIHGRDDVYEDDIAEALSENYNFNSYKGIMTIPKEYRQFSPWLLAGNFYGSIVGLTKGQRGNFIMPSCPNIEYEKEVDKGLLRLVEPEIGKFSPPITGGFDNRIYFPTEKLLDKLLEKE